jgi:hypothetical protein
LKKALDIKIRFRLYWPNLPSGPFGEAAGLEGGGEPPEVKRERRELLP